MQILFQKQFYPSYKGRSETSVAQGHTTRKQHLGTLPRSLSGAVRKPPLCASLSVSAANATPLRRRPRVCTVSLLMSESMLGVRPYSLGEHAAAFPPRHRCCCLPQFPTTAPPRRLWHCRLRSPGPLLARAGVFDVHVNEPMLDMRKEAESYDCRRGFQLTHSMGGGTFAYVLVPVQ